MVSVVIDDRIPVGSCLYCEDGVAVPSDTAVLVCDCRHDFVLRQASIDNISTSGDAMHVHTATAAALEVDHDDELVVTVLGLSASYPTCTGVQALVARDMSEWAPLIWDKAEDRTTSTSKIPNCEQAEDLSVVTGSESCMSKRRALDPVPATQLQDERSYVRSAVLSSLIGQVLVADKAIIVPVRRTPSSRLEALTLLVQQCLPQPMVLYTAESRVHLVRDFTIIPWFTTKTLCRSAVEVQLETVKTLLQASLVGDVPVCETTPLLVHGPEGIGKVRTPHCHQTFNCLLTLISQLSVTGQVKSFNCRSSTFLAGMCVVSNKNCLHQLTKYIFMPPFPHAHLLEKPLILDRAMAKAHLLSPCVLYLDQFDALVKSKLLLLLKQVLLTYQHINTKVQQHVYYIY